MGSPLLPDDIDTGDSTTLVTPLCKMSCKRSACAKNSMRMHISVDKYEGGEGSHRFNSSVDAENSGSGAGCWCRHGYKEMGKALLQLRPAS